MSHCLMTPQKTACIFNLDNSYPVLMVYILQVALIAFL